MYDPTWIEPWLKPLKKPLRKKKTKKVSNPQVNVSNKSPSKNVSVKSPVNISNKSPVKNLSVKSSSNRVSSPNRSPSPNGSPSPNVPKKKTRAATRLRRLPAKNWTKLILRLQKKELKEKGLKKLGTKF